jgi:hypothetical protein
MRGVRRVKRALIPLALLATLVIYGYSRRLDVLDFLPVAAVPVPA